MNWFRPLALAALMSAFTQPIQAANPLVEGDQARDEFISQLLNKMTLDEKAGQLRLICPGEDIPLDKLQTMVEKGQVGGVFNVVVPQQIAKLQQAAMHRPGNKIPLFFAFDVVHGERTIFPIPLGLAASWDRDAVKQAGRIFALEGARDGLNMSWAPMVDITREPRWGRGSEGFGEDTLLSAEIGRAIVESMQGDNPALPDNMMSSVKHFAAYGAVEGGRDYNTVDMSSLRLYQDYLPPYKAAIDAGAGAVMVGLNTVNGVPATASRWLLKDILREQWRFQGVVVSDHGAVSQLVEHGVAKDNKDAVRIAIKAGLDMSMNDRDYSKYVPELVQEGLLTENDIDTAVRHVLNAKYAMGLFKDPFSHIKDPTVTKEQTEAEGRLHRQEAREVAAKSFVLLKNQHQTLPLKKQGTIAVIGPLAASQADTMGSWAGAGDEKRVVTLLTGIQQAVAGKATVNYAKGANITTDPRVKQYIQKYTPSTAFDSRSEQVLRDEAVKVASQADVIVAAVGESQGMAHESSSQSDIQLSATQQQLIDALKATGKPLVIVLMNGRALNITHEDKQADAILETWFSGTEGGHAIADVLFGDKDVSGKLPVSFPRSVGQIPIYYNHLNTGRPANLANPVKYTSYYYDAENGPLYPFGYGLSYTNFTLSPIHLSAKTMTNENPVTAKVTVTNTGKRAGATVVQLYLNDPVASVSRPLKELKAFEKVELKPGQKRVIEFTILPEYLKFWSQDLKYQAEPGQFNVMIGFDSQQTKNASFTLQ
jgi:beta-glucosidase